MKLTFLGAAQTVTGSKHLLTLDNGKSILLDCGLFQGRGVDTEKLNRHFNFNPEKIDYLILSHAHIDHSGNIPRLVKEGFAGKIFCTPATENLCNIMLLDSAHIQESDVYYINKRKSEKGHPLIKPLYTKEDAINSMQYFHPVNYNEHIKIDENIELLFTDAGHILGSAAVHLSINENNTVHRLTFTGDIGRYNNKILRDPQPFPQADTIICESTYGDRLHDSSNLTEIKLLKIVEETCIIKKGKLLIPAFSIGRTQEIIYSLNLLAETNQLPPIKVFVDSPLSINATEIMRNHTYCFNEKIKEFLKKDPDPFGFNNLVYVQDEKESKKINELKEPCIIISASGMMEAGRIKHHLKKYIHDNRNTLLIVGFCEPSTLGGKLANGNKSVSIFGEIHDVNMDVIVLKEFSAHGDYLEMIKFLNCQNKKKVKNLFLVHGELEVQNQFKMHLENAGFKKIIIPEYQSSFTI